MSERMPAPREEPSEALWAATWWRPGSHRLRWQALDDVDALAGAIRGLLDDGEREPDVLAVARDALVHLRASLAPDRRRRWPQLRALWRRHGPDSLAPDQRAGIPNLLWDRLLAHLGLPPRSPGSRARAWLGGEERPFPQGARGRGWIEWWGWPEAPGAAYDDRLWAWGAVQPAAPEDSGATAAIEAVSPRLAWRSEGGRWQVHPAIAGALAGLAAPPRLDDGPGFLLACIVDSMAELLEHSPYTGRDLAALWGTMLLPLIALTTELAPTAAPAPADPVPDYLEMLAFYMLHPRVQSAIVALDQLCTLLVAGDDAALEALLAGLGRASAGSAAGKDPGALDIEARVHALIADVAERALHRRAAPQWNSGFGFKLFRNLLREVLAPAPARFPARWDQAVHGDPVLPGSRDDADVPPPAGNLAHRLREALGTALWYPGRPPYPGGPAVQQILDLVWLRWTDPDFLA